VRRTTAAASPHANTRQAQQQCVGCRLRGALHNLQERPNFLRNPGPLVEQRQRAASTATPPVGKGCVVSRALPAAGPPERISRNRGMALACFGKRCKIACGNTAQACLLALSLHENLQGWASPGRRASAARARQTTDHAHSLQIRAGCKQQHSDTHQPGHSTSATAVRRQLAA